MLLFQTTAFGTDGNVMIEETEDNRDVIENLRDQYALFSNKLMPMVKKWAVTLTKAGDINDQSVLKRTIDAKTKLDGLGDKLKVVKHLLAKKENKKASDDDSSDDDDFIEVEEKLRYEVTVNAEDHDLGISFYSAPSTSRSAAQTCHKTLKVSSSADKLSNRSSKGVLDQWSICDALEDESDPTTLAATLAKLKKQNIATTMIGSKNSAPIEGVAKLPFDTDLYDWGEERQQQKVVIPDDGHR